MANAGRPLRPAAWPASARARHRTRTRCHSGPADRQPSRSGRSRRARAGRDCARTAAQMRPVLRLHPAIARSPATRARPQGVDVVGLSGTLQQLQALVCERPLPGSVAQILRNSFTRSDIMRPRSATKRSRLRAPLPGRSTMATSRVDGAGAAGNASDRGCASELPHAAGSVVCATAASRIAFASENRAIPDVPFPKAQEGIVSDHDAHASLGRRTRDWHVRLRTIVSVADERPIRPLPAATITCSARR